MGPDTGKATPESILLMNAFTLFTEADAVDKATGYSGILKPFNFF